MVNLNVHRIPRLFCHKPLEHLISDRQKKKHAKRAGYLLPVYLVLLICALPAYWGCTFSDTVSDSEAVKLVKSFYLFSRDGREVEARVMHRGKYADDCSCYPITFEIRSKGRKNVSKTFYFFKDQSGTLDVRDFRKMLIQ